MSVSTFDALLVVDMQNDFCKGGALAVAGAEDIIPSVNALITTFHEAGLPVIATQDFHPADHGSFASCNEGVEPGEMFTLSGLPQVAWPDHCVQGTWGVQFNDAVDSDLFDHIVRKGTDRDVDSYSAFFDNAHVHDTGLTGLLQGLEVERLVVCGLATDYCVLYSALDALSAGYKTFVAADATAAVNLDPGDYDRALDDMRVHGCTVLSTAEVLA